MKSKIILFFLFFFFENSEILNAQPEPCNTLEFPHYCPCEGQVYCENRANQGQCTPSPQLLACNDLIDPNGCENSTEAYIEDNCFNPIDKILSRAVTGGALVNLVWERTNPGGLNVQENVNEYCNTLRFYRDSRASLITGAATLWGDNHLMRICTNQGMVNTATGEMDSRNYLVAVRQMVCDINAVYDCAGLVRPFIQANILEHLDQGTLNEITQTPDGITQMVELVPILPCVIAEFVNDPGFPIQTFCQDSHPDGVINNLDLPCVPRNDVYFNYDQMIGTNNIDFQDHEVESDMPEITNIFSQMWFLQNAMLYMDAGINAFSLGQMAKMGRKEKNTGYAGLRNILSKIRGYADDLGIDILIEAEPTLDNNGEDAEYYWLDENGDKHFFFDYHKYPMWFSEVTNTQYTDDLGCKNPEDTYNLFQSQACLSFTQDAVIDMCHLEKLLAYKQEGYSPDGNCYYENMPFQLYFDLGHGCIWQDADNDNSCDPNEVQNNLPTNNFGQAWGYDDSNWFARLPQACKIEWFNAFFCNNFNKSTHNQKLNLAIPGRLGNNICCTGQNFYNIINEPAFMQSVITTMQPELNDWNITYNEPDWSCPPCDLSMVVSQYPYIRHYKTKVKPYVSFSVNPDCTTAYSWHIQKPDLSWLDYQRGPSGSFVPDQEGYYTIYLNRDNKGLETTNPNGWGSNQTSKKIQVKLCDFYVKCINNIQKRNYNFNYSCKPNGSHNVKLKFENESINGITLTTNQGQILTTPIYNYQKSEIEFSYRSAKLPDSNNDIRDVMDINIIDTRYPTTARAIEVMDACNADEARITDVKEISTSKIEIYPNPTSGIINFKLEDSDDFVKKIEIFNLQGKKVVEFNDTKTLKSGSINTQNLLNGIYLIKGLTNKSKFEEKIIISK